MGRSLQRITPVFGLVVTAILCTTVHAETPPASGSRPNIVLIMADDMGFSDIGAFGGEIQTPNLDRLAANGLRLRQYYNTARCCPTRATLLTGVYAHQAGVGHMVEDHGLPGYRGFLNDSCATIAEVLSTAKYHPYHSGKWHVGEQPGHWPADRGFEHSYGLISGGTNYWKLDKTRTFAIDHKSTDPFSEPNYYVTDGFTRAAVQHIGDAAPKAKAGEPFFLYLAYTAPHWPLHARTEDIAKYKGKYMKGWGVLREERLKREIELGIVKPGTTLTPREPNAKLWDNLSQAEKEKWDYRMAVYAAQIDRMDQGIGQVLKKLDELGLTENTLVLFMSDNGGCAEVIERSEVKDAPPGVKESFLSYGRAWANVSNTPFRTYKHWVHEGGISSPFIAYWPGRIKPNTWSSEPAHMVDLMPTFIDLAGAKYPAERNGKKLTPLEGKSLVPILAGGTLGGDRPIFWEHEGNRAVRMGKWKLVAKHNEPWELFDMDADRTELNNLASKETAKVEELKALWEQFAVRAHVEPFDKVQKTPTKKKEKAGGD